MKKLILFITILLASISFVEAQESNIYYYNAYSQQIKYNNKQWEQEESIKLLIEHNPLEKKFIFYYDDELEILKYNKSKVLREDGSSVLRFQIRDKLGHTGIAKLYLYPFRKALLKVYMDYIQINYKLTEELDY